jgi:hypothetical protein
MHKIINHLFFLFLVASAILFSAGSTFAVEKPRQDEDILLDTYYRIEAKLAAADSLSGGIESTVTENHFPVKHRIVDAPKDWPYSTFHRYVEKGMGGNMEYGTNMGDGHVFMQFVL